MSTLFTSEEDFRTQYELAKQTGDKRFGSECKHVETKSGHCTNCLRKIVTKPTAYRVRKG